MRGVIGLGLGSLLDLHQLPSSQSVCLSLQARHLAVFTNRPGKNAVFVHKMTVMDLEAIMELLSQERMRRGLSLEEVAWQAGWANESIPRRLERSGSNPTLRSVERYAQAIGAELSISIVGTRVISFFNHAGGVGKSSAARDLGYVLSSLGFKVLLIDADPQANPSGTPAHWSDHGRNPASHGHTEDLWVRLRDDRSAALSMTAFGLGGY